MPNAESALNEEAGKLLLEQYDDYCIRARMFTEVHARLPRCVRPSDRRTSPKRALGGHWEGIGRALGGHCAVVPDLLRVVKVKGNPQLCQL